MAANSASHVTRVLIADADAGLRNDLSQMLLSMRADALVDVCATGTEAMAQLLHHPDLVIAARELSGLNGLDLLRSVRRDRSKPALPFILLSERVDTASVREAVPFAPTAFLTKPLNMDLLRQRLQALLEAMEQQVPEEVPVMMPGLTLSAFLEQRRTDTEGAPLMADVQTAVMRSLNPKGLNLRLLEEEIRTDPQITAVLLAAANSASVHREAPVQTLLQALAKLGALQSVNLVMGLTLKRSARLSDPELAAIAEYYWGLSLHTAEYGRTLGRMFAVDEERCYCAGLLHCLGDLALLRCLQEWKLAGGKLEEGEAAKALKTFGAGYGSELRRRWRLPLELREMIASIYSLGLGSGVYTRDDLVMNMAAKLARLKPGDELETLAKDKTARLLKLGVEELTRLRRT
ncbi:HDOD domain-containing protein [Pseudomonas sp. HR96]|uniref:HDOD domain-containing protein n=1 Tax=Pseudomonas sp. HR96 TaxID=1027966 RepID=UPI002A74BBBE|nr:HDOD domain-containing protein [Pseudomonas sp. HR96]WPP00100.1 HDOD domain-containing protein [Pseudomonas sp. HR96]